MMRGLRIAVVVVVRVLELAGFVTVLITYESAGRQYGFNLGPDGVTIIAVEPGLPAAKRGVLPPATGSCYESLPGTRTPERRFQRVGRPWRPRCACRSIHAGKRRARSTVTPVELPWLYGMADLSFALAGLALGAVSLGLVLLRPSRMTWGFVLVAPPLLLPDVLFRRAAAAPHPGSAGFEIAVALMYALQAAGTMVFASRFPSDDPAAPIAPSTVWPCRSESRSREPYVYIHVTGASGWRPRLRRLDAASRRTTSCRIPIWRRWSR